MLRALILATCVTGCSGGLLVGSMIQDVTNNKLGREVDSPCLKGLAIVGAIVEGAIAGAVIYHDDHTVEAVILPAIALDGIVGALVLKSFCK